MMNVVAAVLVSLALSADGSLDVNVEIEQTLRQLHQMDVKDRFGDRIDLAEQLCETLGDLSKQGRLKGVKKSTIVDLARALSDDEDGVRAWIAGALGLIGPDAYQAVPSLERALVRIEGIEAREAVIRLDSNLAIRIALHRITGKPVDSFP